MTSNKREKIEHNLEKQWPNWTRKKKKKRNKIKKNG